MYVYDLRIYLTWVILLKYQISCIFANLVILIFRHYNNREFELKEDARFFFRMWSFAFTDSRWYCYYDLLFAHTVDHFTSELFVLRVIFFFFLEFHLNRMNTVYVFIFTIKIDEFKLENCSFNQIMVSDYRNNKKKCNETNVVYIVWMLFLYHIYLKKKTRFFCIQN